MDKGKKRRYVFSEGAFTGLEEPGRALIILGDTGESTKDVSRSITALESIFVKFRHKVYFFLDA
ncbi:MAG: hypothetical protein NPIRA03_20210 [Nitrospirales bacterium]|nr:MAG: hypothetical protein NPIRA03_20210 [Nitrospirales bacterium]